MPESKQDLNGFPMLQSVETEAGMTTMELVATVSLEDGTVQFRAGVSDEGGEFGRVLLDAVSDTPMGTIGHIHKGLIPVYISKALCPPTEELGMIDDGFQYFKSSAPAHAFLPDAGSMENVSPDMFVGIGRKRNPNGHRPTKSPIRGSGSQVRRSTSSPFHRPRSP